MAQPSGKRVAPSLPSATPRNTARSVVPIRLSDAERAQITGAASRRDLTLSGFIRQAALEVSARVKRRVTVREKPPPEPERPPFGLLDASPRHAFVDGICKRCHQDEDERDSPCIGEAA
jgi:hypothetical protein